MLLESCIPLSGGNSRAVIRLNRRLLYYHTQNDFKVLSTPYCHLLYLLTPEYQAAARVALTTTSTGIRSATALLEALIVRRIPFPALKNKTNQKIHQ